MLCHLGQAISVFSWPETFDRYVQQDGKAPAALSRLNMQTAGIQLRFFCGFPQEHAALEANNILCMFRHPVL